jgi:hypothetical protein
MLSIALNDSLGVFTQNSGYACWIAGVVDISFGSHVVANADSEQVVEGVGVSQRWWIHAGVLQ